MAFRNGPGSTPIRIAMAIVGTSTQPSRHVRSASCRFFSLVTGPKLTRWNIQTM